MGGIAALSINISGQSSASYGSNMKIRQLEALKKNAEEELENKDIKGIDKSKLNEKISRVENQIERLEVKEDKSGNKSTDELSDAEKRRRFDSFECSACENRRYQDGSDDSGVSFQNPTKVNPAAAEGAVRAHENQHVTRNKAEADREGRKIISQTVTIKHATCPECGKNYVAGGVTRTTTAPDNSKQINSSISKADNSNENNGNTLQDANKQGNVNKGFKNQDNNDNSIFKLSKGFGVGMFDDTHAKGNGLDTVA